MTDKEYMVHIWGGAWNKDADPSIEKDLGIKEGFYYFSDKLKKDNFLKLFENPIYKNQGIAISEKYGIMSHKKTILTAIFQYNNKNFIINYDFGYEYPEDSAIFMFIEGNYACDCNRSLFIQEQYGKDSIPELPCGHEISMLKYIVKYED